MKRSAVPFILFLLLLFSPLPSDAADRGYAVHSVRQGDTLQSIADERGISLQDLASANGYAGPDPVLAPGALLLVPKGASHVLATLYEAKRHGLGGWPKPRYGSEFLSPLVPEPPKEAPQETPLQGTRLPVVEDPPVTGELKTPNVKEELPPPPGGEDKGEDKTETGPVQGTPPVPSGGTYTIREGDTLYSLARRSGVPLERLIEANGLHENSIIRAGETLTIPDLQAPPAPREDTRESAVPAAPPDEGGLREETAPPLSLGWPLRGERDPGAIRKDPGHGLTIQSREETSILAAADGTVLHGGWMKNFGNAVFIQHRDGFATFYGYLGILYVRSGQTVHRGDRIGLVGKREEPKVAFHLLKDGKSVDPTPYMTATAP